ncbi:MAG: glycosyltransferase family 4 protein [Acidobacteriaceae bacterium]
MQILKTAECLRALGCEIEISVDPDVAVDEFDIVHLFNITRPQETYLPAKKAHQRRIPVVISSIYVDYREADRATRSPLQRLLFRCIPGSSAEYLKMTARAVVNREINPGTSVILRKGFRKAQRELIEISSIMLPNSESEMSRIRRDFPEAAGADYAVVPNAIDPRLFAPEHTARAQGYEDCVLSVGRIERRKCQLELVRALKGTGLRLVIIGKPGPNQMKYMEKIRREADDAVTFIGQVDHADLPRYYAACKVHALVSWMETTGLSSLEAGVMGANIVITEKGDTRDYFGDLAYYCSPDSVESIRGAVLRAHRAPRSNRLREKILQQYTWADTARCTLEAYRRVLEKG